MSVLVVSYFAFLGEGWTSRDALSIRYCYEIAERAAVTFIISVIYFNPNSVFELWALLGLR